MKNKPNEVNVNVPDSISDDLLKDVNDHLGALLDAVKALLIQHIEAIGVTGESRIALLNAVTLNMACNAIGASISLQKRNGSEDDNVQFAAALAMGELLPAILELLTVSGVAESAGGDIHVIKVPVRDDDGANDGANDAAATRH